MPSGLVASLTRLFDTTDLYAVLGLQDNKKASDSELKRAYRKTSLAVHPDRAKEDQREKATEKFQCMGAVYKVLSDPDTRALYDESGEIVEDDGCRLVDGEGDWAQYWRLLFKKITLDDIKKFEDTYRDSEEELNDLKQAYVDGEGDMDYIMDNVMCCTLDDEERFSNTLKDLIESEDIPNFKKFSKEAAKKRKERKRRMEGEKEEAEEMAVEMGLGQGADGLRNAIMQRQEKRAAESESFLDQLAAKYGGGGSSGKKSKGKKK